MRLTEVEAEAEAEEATAGAAITGGRFSLPRVAF
jgi:hypothetical protein